MRNQFQNHNLDDEGEPLGDDLAAPIPRDPEDLPMEVVKTLEEQVADGDITREEARRLAGIEPPHIRSHEDAVEEAARPSEAFLKHRKEQMKAREAKDRG